MSCFKKSLLVSAIVFASQGVFPNDSLFAMRDQENQVDHSHITIPQGLSEEAKGSLAFFDSFITTNKRKLFDAFPSPNDAEGWTKRFIEGEGFMTALNDDVVTQLRPTVTSSTINGIPVLEIEPQGWKENGQILVYLHGGGFTMNSAATQKIGSVPLAAKTGLKTVIVDYTRAPVAKQPEILDQVVSVFKGLKLDGYKMEDIAVYGDSAGGNLATAAILQMRDMGMGMPAALALWSPWLDLTGSGDTSQTMEPQDPILSADALEKCALAYAPKDTHGAPLVSPLFGDFTKGMSPTLIQYGTKEMLASDSMRLHTVLKKAGHSTTLSPQEGMWHAFQAFGWQLPESETALNETAQFLQGHLGTSPKI